MNNAKRLISLDVLRGLTVMMMIFVNNGAGDDVFVILRHSKWNGMTPCDLVFPSFLFIMGVSTYLSLRKQNFQWSRGLALKIVKRTVLLFLVGLFINWYKLASDGNPFDFAHLRILGVMQRIALCYFFTAVATLGSKASGSLKLIPWMIVGLLIIYTIIILVGGGYTYDSSTNILYKVDNAILGDTHLYHRSPIDPEGLLSTISAIAQTMIGFWCGKLMMETENIRDKMLRLLLVGSALILIGWLLTFGLPLNKRIWSPSYVLMTCGFTASAWALLLYLIDYRPSLNRHFINACLIFGTNPLFLYVVSEVIGLTFNASGIKMGIYHAILPFIQNGYWTSVAYSTLFTALHVLFGYPLWKRKIFIKL